jgi:hypothetical protein
MSRSQGSTHGVLVAVAVALGAAVPSLAWAQTGPPAPGAAGGAGAGTVTVQPQAPQAASPYAPPPPGATYGPPPAANGTIGGGNATESSAHPITGDQEDSFDLSGAGRGGGVARGDERGPVFIGSPTYPVGETPASHVVRRGDTLWSLCDRYFQNPYQWPRVWSYNPQIKNPHWIYPGDEVRLKEGTGGGGEGNTARTGGGAGSQPQDKMSLVDRRRQVPNGTVFLRDQGWLGDESDELWGDITGSAEDKMFLTDLDEVYLGVRPGHDVKIGQELTIFRPRQTAAAGTIVQILGTARVDQWNSHDRIARAQIVETLDVIERGASIGPIARRFEIVAPKRNDAEVRARVLASLHPNILFGQNQVVFIDKGEAAGLKPGNRLFVMRRGDAWRTSLVTPGAGYRVSPDDERPLPPMEKTPGASRAADKYPDEVVAELRVVSVKKESAACLVTQSSHEIEMDDVAVARRGY